LSSFIAKINELKVNFEKGQLLGVDVGLSSVKIALLGDAKKGKFRLEKFMTYPLSEAVVIEDEIQRPEEVISAIEYILKEQKIQKKISCLGMSGPNTVSKRIQVPSGAKDEVEDNILWESEQYIPFGADDAEIGFSIVHEDADVVDAIVGAVRIDIVESYMNVLKTAGLTTKIVDLNVFALSNVFESIVEDRIDEISEKGAVLIDFGAQYTTVIVYKNGAPVLTKEIGIGGVLLTEEIQRTMGVSYEEAEDLKINGDENGNLPEEIIELLELHLQKLTSELRKILNFYIAVGSSDQVKFMFMTGGSSRLPGIKEALLDLIDIEPEELDPFEAITIKGKFDEDDLEEIRATGITAIGLAMRSV
jgi:type IV pilus assembly protein PilM